MFDEIAYAEERKLAHKASVLQERITALEQHIAALEARLARLETQDDAMTIICAWCGVTISGAGDAAPNTVSHSICEACVRKYFPEEPRKTVGAWIS